MTRSFGGLLAVDDVSLDVARGERRAVIGPNGAGKTTLFRLITGEHPPSAGTIELFGRDITALSIRARTHLGLGRTFQDASVFDGLTVAESLQLGVLGRRRGHLSIRPVPRQVVQDASELAGQVGLGDRLNVLAADLSHGERRQLEIGLALGSDPSVLMLDEPAAGLAKGERARLVTLLNELREDRTVLLIEHDMEIALGIADRVTMLHDGRVVSEGTSEQVSADPVVHRLYLGGQHAEAVVDSDG